MKITPQDVEIGCGMILGFAMGFYAGMWLQIVVGP